MTILITGANRGIGAALLAHYATAGEAALGTARKPEGALLPLDVTEPESHAALARRLAGKPISLLVCNAGVYPDKGQRLDRGYSAALWAAGFATNVTGVFLTVQSLLPNLRAGKGKIAIISSSMGSQARAPGGSYIYRASKAAALNLGRNLATDLAPEGIAVGIYHPGWVKTTMGGPEAEITPEAAVAGLAARFRVLSAENTGCFEGWDGEAIPF
ncbi:short-chain dehydrogenase [Rhodobacter veldkampii DSM 11550]|uniref:Short-chain dehydrogenase n=1 Tax=Phaeovulum veldkampii DSM 11550 TaxID=1185920 RepID=A0A2T4JHC9_9RHOB|nr:SDR family NAD(P)-dependent oxidoreductase [Phaeovulum veldkampii]MBK5945568.1 short-chain dehydrogenase [Phaeovulum veldkampii DSM 11550]NCU19915.1 SDR family NAD(P)-dependent oxidoreductase [Candidatus Falkowbacteria bacterium]PTE17324.1 short-chain dehydrogenase [Phaeovulum veldkampii DSM 11550]TDQ56330.1 NADP-dependent 3-hydroxy acid dehydrogenase YdfG [Phaeovulum veldkampii DSM 11550]